MSQETVEVVRSSFEAFARGAFADAFSSYDPGTEWCTAVDEPDQRTYRPAGGIADPLLLVEKAGARLPSCVAVAEMSRRPAG